MLQANVNFDGPLLRLHGSDNVLIAREGLALGQQLRIGGELVRMRAQVAPGHKVAAARIAAGAPIRKYDTVIGRAARDIAQGEHVHTHNMELVDFARDPGFGLDVRPVDYVPAGERATFDGIVRADGRVATRNFIGILASVNCSATVIKHIAARFTPERLARYPNVDGVVAFAQTSGCGMSSPSEHFDVLRRTLAGYARHANLAGVLIVGLGCERNQVAELVDSQALDEGPAMRTLVMQAQGGTRATIEAGIAAVEQMLPAANEVVRRPVSASHLKIGLECGGSDGFSGITANPALGAAMDLLVRHGGTAILSETPEIHGVEYMLTRRAVSPEVGRKLLDRLQWWERYTHGHNGQFNGVVGPGNQQGGLANIFEKSLGSAMKGGTTPLQAVYEYAEPIDRAGFVFMDSPGYDPVAVTGQIASGANLICFTTGRGSMFGSKPAPTLKLASNTPMYRRLEDDMDVNCGLVLDGERTIEEMGRDIFERILRTASGQRTKSELLDLGDHEFVPWHMGIVS
ncbi:altronate dehydratase family protein [Trinickia caryophylli]|uniref:Altronate hydrolase n=1 Tax=Trinickia caryophylli TaxID=28094 RepID=A0A1X7D1Q4_TRICW|nr:altronate dehydratase family protein [Trinickia caryophylli]PMS13590.1 altronate dehydratase [Trinickia caryophylli]TRX15240.1 altronate dehydratase [Trinickia caryophylli]WQE15113.1 altronate dehydratase family protein [Trinickia caryophylli]SMF07110.1 altronate hydrolase [Trinickia caryophylli]GLU31149.1 dehydratase [Trinickia caryophylli]